MNKPVVRSVRTVIQALTVAALLAALIPLLQMLNAGNPTGIADLATFERLLPAPSTALAQSGTVILTKTLNTAITPTVGSPISFTIEVTNIGTDTITALSLTDVYATTYLGYDSAADAQGPNPATEPADDGTITWANIIDFDNDGLFNPGETIAMTVWFSAKEETRNALAAECAAAGNTYNKVMANGVESCVQFFIEPPEPKSTVGDYIWHDINGDGIKDTNEPGLNGVLVNLYEDGANGGTLDGVPQASELISSTMTADDVGGLGSDTGTTNGAGFYQFTVAAEDNDIFIVEVDASNFGAGGVLEGYEYMGTGDPYIAEIFPTTPDSKVDADFGFYCRFDLALDKKVDGASSIAPGEDITFTLTLYNQGIITATSATVAEYIPDGFTLSPANTVTWSGGPTGTVTATIPGPIGPGMTSTVSIRLTADLGLSGTFANAAEISDAVSEPKDEAGNSYPDADSTPDDENGNGPGESTNLEDGQLNEDPNDPLNPGDEDDHDIASFTVEAPVVFGDRVWLEDDGDGLAATGSITPVEGIVITATNGTDIYTATTDANGYYSLTVPADTYTVTYGTVPATYGAVEPSTVVSGTTESGSAGSYREAGNPDANHGQDTVVTLLDGEENYHVDFAFTPLPVSFGDSIWIEDDTDGLKSTGTITPVIGLVITATNGTDVYTTTTNANGYYSFTLPADTYTVTYGSVPPVYGNVTPSNAPGGATESGSAGSYREPGNPDIAHENGTVVTLLPGEDNWHVDFAFTVSPEPRLAVMKTLNGANPFGVSELISYTIEVMNTGPVTLTVVPLEDRYNSVFLEYDSASLPPNTAARGVVLWDDLTAALGDISPGMSISFIVTFTTLADTSLLTPVAPCISDGHAPNLAIVEDAWADPDGEDGDTGDDFPVVADSDDRNCAEVEVLAPTAVQLGERSMTQSSAGVLVRWTTVSESEIVGFNMWRSSGVTSEQRNGKLIVAQNLGQASGSSYEWLDEGATLQHGDAYVLEIVKSDSSIEKIVIDVVRAGPLYLPLIVK